LRTPSQWGPWQSEGWGTRPLDWRRDWVYHRLAMGKTYKSVQFWPAVGCNYEKSGLTNSGLKLLILGESHYPWEGMPKDLRLTTRDAIKAKDKRRFWKDIANLFDRGSDFWDDVIFYNFVQKLVGDGPRQRPQPSMWECKQTINGFKEICQHHTPDRILVIGKTNWKNMPGNKSFPDIALPREESRFPLLGERFRKGLDDSEQYAYWYPTVGGNFALCAPVFHPAYPAGFNLPATRETVKTLMKKSWKPPL
jgi:hypothetical protein